MFIINRYIWCLLVAITLSTSVAYTTNVQSDTIAVGELAFFKSKNYTILPNVWFFGGGGGHFPTEYKKVLSFNKTKLHTSNLQAGIQGEFIIHEYHYNKSYAIRFGASLGYKYEQISIHPWIYDQNGVNLHWLMTEAYFGFWYLYLGVYADICLAHSIKNADYYTYNGIYDDCLKDVVPGAFFGIQLPLPYIRFDFRLGIDFYPRLNGEKFVYHNGGGFSYQPLHLEARVGIPLFMMGNKIRSANATLIKDRRQ